MRKAGFCFLALFLTLSSFADEIPQDKPGLPPRDEAREKLRKFLIL